MEYRTLGRSGCAVSTFALGTMTFGAETDELGSHRQLDAFVESGGTLVAPGNLGGSNWEPAAFDPDTGMLYVGSWTNPTVYALTSNPQRSDMNYIAGNAQVPRVSGLPILKPPYSRITAINLQTGQHAWMVPNSDTPEWAKNNPALKGLTIPRTGQAGIIGTLTTRGLVIAGESRVTTTSTGVRGAMLRAYDKNDGKEVGAVYIPAPQSGSPMTYMLNGKQYIIVAVSGGNYSGELIAFKLPG